MKHLALFALVVVIGVSVYIALQKVPRSPVAGAYSLSDIEIVDSIEERTVGLSGRTDVPDDYGMLFIFPFPDMYGFWMKDMHVSIDIIWLSDEGTILAVESNVNPNTYPKSFYPPEPVRYVLETRAGLAEERRWKEGVGLKLPLR